MSRTNFDPLFTFPDGSIPFVRKVLLASLGDDPPAITAVAVHDLPLKDARVQIEAVAV